VGEAVYSELLTVNGFSFRLAVYPQGVTGWTPCRVDADFFKVSIIERVIFERVIV